MSTRQARYRQVMGLFSRADPSVDGSVPPESGTSSSCADHWRSPCTEVTRARGCISEEFARLLSTHLVVYRGHDEAVERDAFFCCKVAEAFVYVVWKPYLHRFHESPLSRRKNAPGVSTAIWV